MERGGEIMKKARAVLFVAAALLLVLFLTMFLGGESGEAAAESHQPTPFAPFSYGRLQL